MKKIILYNANRLHSNSNITLENRDTTYQLSNVYDYDKTTVIKTTTQTGSDALIIEWSANTKFDLIKIYNHNLSRLTFYKWTGSWELIQDESGLLTDELTIELDTPIETNKVKVVLGQAQGSFFKQIGELILCEAKAEFTSLKISRIDFDKYRLGGDYRLINTKLTSWHIGEKLSAKVPMINLLESEISTIEDIYNISKEDGYGVCVYLEDYKTDFIQADITEAINAKYIQTTDLYSLILYIDEI